MFSGRPTADFFAQKATEREREREREWHDRIIPRIRLKIRQRLLKRDGLEGGAGGGGCGARVVTRSSLVLGNEGCTGPSRKVLCLCQATKCMQHKYVIIPYYMFDYWADPVVHLLLLPKELHGGDDEDGSR